MKAPAAGGGGGPRAISVTPLGGGMVGRRHVRTKSSKAHKPVRFNKKLIGAFPKRKNKNVAFLKIPQGWICAFCVINYSNIEFRFA